MAIPGTGVPCRMKLCGAEKSSGEGSWRFSLEAKMDVRGGGTGHPRAGACVCISERASGEAVQMSTFFGASFLLFCQKSFRLFHMATWLGCGLRHIAGWQWSHSSTLSFLLRFHHRVLMAPLPLAPSFSISTGFSKFDFGRKRV